MNPTVYRIVCDVCGVITHTLRLDETSRAIYRKPNGSYEPLMLCPNHVAEWDNFVSTFLGGEAVLPFGVKS